MPASMTIRQAEDWLAQRQLFTIKLGLDRTRNLLAELGNPQDRLQIIHIAGTNGKGSVGASLLALLSAAGFRTGFYSSPHLADVRERFRIDDRLISEADFATLVARLAALTGSRDHQPTYFECTTLLALMWFAEQKVDAAILETGMGGRLDATNVVRPRVAIITDISRDHEQHLGPTIAAIAGEKAGIVKAKVPTVFSGRASEAVAVIEARCQQLHSPLSLFGRDFFAQAAAPGTFDYQGPTGTKLGALPLMLQGAHQVVNAGVALAALELLAPVFPVSPEAIAIGLRQVRWPCRMEVLAVRHRDKNLRVLLDGAHNEAGVAALAQGLRAGYPGCRLLLIWGNMADKHMGQPLLDLLALANAVMLTRTESPRFAEPQMLYAGLPPAIRDRTDWCETVEQALDRMLARAEPDDLVCVAGSLYLAGRVRRILTGGPAA
ncbi:folylpolyglutamate synthase/dihydrofolate synthase family protein [Desulfobulbus sp.]|uniref:bifunctional folylpolyglutamate synthase/dihydrofolate synthase n=1 Tax=Desulfobulbus sp. TaxID=895 RepID=UPI00286EBF82|nr:folylpolyglutamate synthase/dihydrofolate synthase family protein [Desulfobulbus sp.]